MERKKILKSTLGKREAEVLWLVGTGLTNKEIAVKLGIVIPTVKRHLHNVVNKLLDNKILNGDLSYIGGVQGVRGTSAFAAEAAAEHGLIPPLPREAFERIEQLKRFHNIL